jgi:serine/threonine-protein kinase RsbW
MEDWLAAGWNMHVEAPKGFHILVWQTDWGGHIVLTGEAGPGDTSELAYVFRPDLFAPGTGVSVDSRNLTLVNAELALAETLKRLSEHVPIVATAGTMTVNPAAQPLWQLHSYSLPPTRWASSFARSQVGEIASGLDLMPKDLEDIKIAVGEAVTNAVRHGCAWHSQNRVGLKCTAEPGRLEVIISDCGPGFDLKSAQLCSPRPAADGGHGLGIIERSVDECYISCENGTTVRLIKYIKKGEK